MNLTADGQTVMENRYRYDAVDNILGITNAANPTSLTKLNKAKLGGRSSHTYEYDELNRLIHANGKAKGCIVWYGDVVRTDEWTADEGAEGGLNDNY